MAAHAAYIRAVQGSSPCVPTNNASFVSGEATGLQNRQDQFDSDTMLQVCSCKPIGRLPRYERVSCRFEPCREYQHCPLA